MARNAAGGEGRGRGEPHLCTWRARSAGGGGGGTWLLAPCTRQAGCGARPLRERSRSGPRRGRENQHISALPATTYVTVRGVRVAPPRDHVSSHRTLHAPQNGIQRDREGAVGYGLATTCTTARRTRDETARDDVYVLCAAGPRRGRGLVTPLSPLELLCAPSVERATHDPPVSTASARRVSRAAGVDAWPRRRRPRRPSGSRESACTWRRRGPAPPRGRSH